MGAEAIAAGRSAPARIGDPSLRPAALARDDINGRPPPPCHSEARAAGRGIPMMSESHAPPLGSRPARLGTSIAESRVSAQGGSSLLDVSVLGELGARTVLVDGAPREIVGLDAVLDQGLAAPPDRSGDDHVQSLGRPVHLDDLALRQIIVLAVERLGGLDLVRAVARPRGGAT